LTEQRVLPVHAARPFINSLCLVLLPSFSPDCPIMADKFSPLRQSAALFATASKSIFNIGWTRFSAADDTGNFPKRDTAEFNEMMGGLLGSVVLRAFSIELALKALCVKRGVTYPKTHNLAELFAILPSTDRNTAATGYHKKNPTSQGGLEALLKANANAFDEWRYQHESRPTTVAFDEMTDAFDEIYALLN
jgi:hypothetical protein